MKAATYLLLMAALMVATWSENLRDAVMMVLGALIFMLAAKIVRS